MKNILTQVLALATLSASAWAAPQAFDFKDPKGVNNVVFKLDAPLEAINGSASGITGTIHFDPANPGATTGKITVAAASLHVPNPVMKEHLHGAQWMDVAKFPELTFEAKSFGDVQTKDNITRATVKGSFTAHGVTKDVSVPVRLTYLKDKLGARTGGQAQGDLLVLRADFRILRSDFGINPQAPDDKVANEIDLTLSVAGASPK